MRKIVINCCALFCSILVMSFNDLPHFHLHVSVLQSTLKPEMGQSPDDNFSFDEWNNNYSASLDKDDYLCDRSLSFSVPKTPENMETLMQKKGGGHLSNDITQGYSGRSSRYKCKEARRAGS